MGSSQNKTTFLMMHTLLSMEKSYLQTLGFIKALQNKCFQCLTMPCRALMPCSINGEKPHSASDGDI